MSDNRDYLYHNNSTTKRVEFLVIEKIVGENKKVIDLGCGDGSLMEILKRSGNICTGVEVSESGCKASRAKGFRTIRARIDAKLPFKNRSFDIAVCNVTIQMVMYPEILISEMRRISSMQIVTFPNFGFFLNRLQLMFLGTMPTWSLFGYKWYSTGHLHQLSIRDFENYCRSNKIKISAVYHLFPGPIRKFLENSSIIRSVLSPFSNLVATLGIFITKS